VLIDQQQAFIVSRDDETLIELAQRADVRESDSGVTSRANFSAELSGGRATDWNRGFDLEMDSTLDWISEAWIIAMSRAISSPDGSTGRHRLVAEMVGWNEFDSWLRSD
jgi:hypothetical protein